MKVLVACEESQEVCKAFREKGHEAYSCDIIECSGGHPEWHIMEDVLPLLDGRCIFKTMDGVSHFIDGKWDMIIAFPPCTYLSNAGACRLYPKKGQLDMDRYQKGLEAKEFFMSFYNADCPRIAIENPVSSRIFEMPPHSQEIQPYMFGHPYTKKTRLWLRGLPPLIPTDLVDLSVHMCRLVQEGKTEANTDRQSVGRMQKTEARPSLASPKQWLSSGGE